MLVLRPIAAADLPALERLAAESGPGMTSMPTNRAVLEQRIADSEAGFASAAQAPGGEVYMLALEDTETGAVVGTSGIYAGVGLTRPFYSFRLSTVVYRSDDLDITNRMRTLHLVNDFTGATEVGSLFLSEPYRQGGVGQLLARSRYLMMAQTPERFGEWIMAEIRGWQDADGTVPVWEHLGRKFFGLQFQDADYISGGPSNRFIAELMPRHPIYVDLLPAEAAAALGKPHRDSAAAKRMLEKDGFEYDGYVDIFDGGPSLAVRRDRLYTAASSRYRKVQTIDPAPGEAARMCVVGNARVAGARFVVAEVAELDGTAVRIGADTAAALQVDVGDAVRFVPLGFD